MKNKKWLLLAVPIVILGCVALFTRGRIEKPDAPDTPDVSDSSAQGTDKENEDFKPFDMAFPDYEYQNPTDFSDMEPGTEFHDDFWHGTVTIVGKTQDIHCSYDEWGRIANGRLLTAQNGQYILVDKDPMEQSPDIVQSDDDDRREEEPLPEGDEAFYQSPSVELDLKDIYTRYGPSNFFPTQSVAGLRFVAKQFLTDMGLGDVTKLTGDFRTTQFAYSPRGFRCSMDTREGWIGLYFDSDSGEWKCSYSGLNDGESYVSYSPVDFVAPSNRDAVREEINALVGYRKYQEGDETKNENTDTGEELSGDAPLTVVEEPTNK